MWFTAFLSGFFIVTFGLCGIYLFGNIVSYSCGPNWAGVFWLMVIAGALSTIGAGIVLFEDDRLPFIKKSKKRKTNGRLKRKF